MMKKLKNIRDIACEIPIFMNYLNFTEFEYRFPDTRLRICRAVDITRKFQKYC